MIRITFTLLYLLHFLPLALLHLLAYPLSYLAYLFAKERRRVGAINLNLCFPEKNFKERQRILKANFYHMTAMLLEYSFCWYASAKKIKRKVVIDNTDYLYRAQKSRQHLLLLCPHFCALELSALRLSLSFSLISIFTGQKNTQLDRQLYSSRTRFHQYHPVHLIRRNEKIISIIHLLKRSPALFLYLPDQDIGYKDSIFVPFFNIPTATTTGVARLSHITCRQVLPILPIRKFGVIHLKIFSPLNDFPSGDVVADTKRINLLIEKFVYRYPEQYFWMHKRFKTRPKGEKSVY